MKRTVSVLLGVVLLGCQPLAWADDPLPPPQRTLPGGLTVNSIDELDILPAAKEVLRENVRLMKEQKLVPAAEGRLPDFDAIEAHYRARGKPLSEVTAAGKIGFAPAGLDATPLRGLADAAIPGGVRRGTVWSGVARLFRHPELGIVILEETDLRNGGGAMFTREMINADVNGAPAMLLSKQSSSGRSESRLMWFVDGMLYELRTPGVDDRSRDALLATARALSR
ncbi:hypothetical protein [Pseudoduganella sp. GCM10020061]|uniref:hypothetical protein n=1 Tax=Pseudoduganella sp. GCM10020061 TaxID=3317345 RepID=UPI003642DD73